MMKTPIYPAAWRRMMALLLLLGLGLLMVACAEDVNRESDSIGAHQSDTEGTTAEKGDDDMISPPEIILDSMLPKAKRARVFYRMNVPSALSDQLAVAAMQGISARYSDEQILLSAGAHSLYTSYIKNEYDGTVKNFINGAPVTVKTLATHFKQYLKGYILCQNDAASESVNVAISLAGVLDCAIATPENEQVLKEAGLLCVLDVTEKDDAWLRESEYWDKLSKKVAVEQPNDMCSRLADYAVMAGAYFNFYSGNDMEEHKQMFAHLEDHAVVFGYNNTLGEYETVKSLSELNLQLIPADHAFNLSVLSGFSLENVEQKTAESDDGKIENVHTVCFILSDGDNLQWITNDFATSDRWYDSSLRGSFCMGWGLPPTAGELIAPMTSYLYNKMTLQDEFIMQLSGLGYTFPSLWEQEQRRTMAEEVAKCMTALDMKYMEILDTNGFSEQMLEDFTAQDGIEGIFYIDYDNYAGENGSILWTNDKPAVSARYRLWYGTESTPQTLPIALNNASTDVTSADAYSFVIVHAWSGMEDGVFGEGGSPLEAISTVIEQLGDHVEVVTPGEFMERIKENVAH